MGIGTGTAVVRGRPFARAAGSRTPRALSRSALTEPPYRALGAPNATQRTSKPAWGSGGRADVCR